MAKSTARPPKKPTPIDLTTPFDSPLPDTNGAEPAQTAASEPASDPKPAPPKLPSFYQTMNKVAKADWGPRATIYLYRVEPVIDRTRSGDLKYIMTYAEPINEDRIMADCGSGRYKLILNFRKPGADQGDTVDTTYMEILNMKFPPKIPIGEWTDDPRNRKWAWAKEAAAGPPPPPPPTGVETFVDVLRATGDIRREIREEMQGSAPDNGTSAVDPWSAAEKILNMRSENPMVAILQQQMKDAATAAENERARAFTASEAAREREFKLQEKLLEAKTAVVPAKGIIEQLGDLAAISEKLDPLKKLFGFNGTGDTVARAGRTGALDVVRDLGSKFFESDLATGVGQWLGSLAQRNMANNPAPSTMNGAPPPAQVQASPDQQFQSFITNVLNPALLRHYLQEFTGADFAGWLYDGYPDRLVQLQSFTHPMMPGLKGAPAIIQAYKRTDSMWPALSSRGEQAFSDFVHQFCEWKPEPAVDAEVIETQPEGEEGPERI